MRLFARVVVTLLAVFCLVVSGVVSQYIFVFVWDSNGNQNLFGQPDNAWRAAGWFVGAVVLGGLSMRLRAPLRLK